MFSCQNDNKNQNDIQVKYLSTYMVCSKDEQVNPTYLIIYLSIIVWGWVATKYSDFWEEILQCTMRMIKIDAEWVEITENYPKWSKIEQE